jgi:XTP/dITP diphosphohydrolase
MPFPDRLLVATRNPKKLHEIQTICVGWPVRWQASDQASWPEVEETGTTYLDNARLKAHAAASATAVTALAEDSGIEVAGLDSRPGPRSARYAGESASDLENLQELIEELRGLPEETRRGTYRCVAVVAWADGRELWAEGACEGTLLVEPHGSGGFGYDPIFVPLGHPRTMAQLSLAEKNTISHRGHALRALAAKLCGGS